MLIHSQKKKIWKTAYTSSASPEVLRIADELKLSSAAAKLLYSRGYVTPTLARSFIEKEKEMLHDPFLLADMDSAVERILSALDRNEKIAVYGDYDVDGVTSVTVVYSYLKSLGADVMYHIPNRIGEGYGVNIEALEKFANDGVSLVITVDTGITAFDEVNAAKDLGLDIVITDHHECRAELPLAVAVVNPRRVDCRYPFKELAGVGVAFKLISAVEMKRRCCDFYAAVSKLSRDYADVVAIGTIADVMPLVDENRIIVSYGLSLLENTKNVGLKALMHASGLITEDAAGRRVKKKITSASVGFTLAPRINAAGRISSAEFALELFLTEDPLRAEEIAAELCETNRRRQAEENSIIEAAEAKLNIQFSEDDRIIVLDDDHWHHGVIGIVCSRLTEKYNLPTILISFEHNMGDEPSSSDIGKGSGRSVRGLNLFEALDSCSKLLYKYGGHELAAGLSVERGKLADFRKAINAYADKILSGKELCRIVDIDLALVPEEVSLRLASELYLLEPFGVSNSQPVFETDRLIITEIIPMSGGKHTRLTLRAAGIETTFCALVFGTSTDEFAYSVGDAVDICYNLDINEFKGRQSVQLLIRDIRLSSVSEVPTRDDFVKLYRYLKKEAATSVVNTSLVSLSAASGTKQEKLSVILDVLAELSMISLVRGDTIEVSLLPVSHRTPLENSLVLRTLLRHSSS